MAKLVEILARELGEWPEGAAFVVQDYDGEVKYQFSNKEPETQSAGVWIRDSGDEPHDGIIFYAIAATDYATAIVTREMWEAERTKLAGKDSGAPEHGFNRGEPGMDLRDYFAAKAMQALIEKNSLFVSDDREHSELVRMRVGVSISSYLYADAMLAARSK